MITKLVVMFFCVLYCTTQTPLPEVTQISLWDNIEKSHCHYGKGNANNKQTYLLEY